MARAILAEYFAYLPLTIRQVFYRAVGQYGCPKDEKAYKRLIDTLGNARRSHMIPMRAIRDDGVTKNEAGGFSSLESFEVMIKDAPNRYTRKGQSGQGRRLLLMCEAGGMVPPALQGRA